MKPRRNAEASRSVSPTAGQSGSVLIRPRRNILRPDCQAVALSNRDDCIRPEINEGYCALGDEPSQQRILCCILIGFEDRFSSGRHVAAKLGHKVDAVAGRLFECLQPAAGRTTRDGRILVNGRALEETDLWRRDEVVAIALIVLSLASIDYVLFSMWTES